MDAGVAALTTFTPHFHPKPKLGLGFPDLASLSSSPSLLAVRRRIPCRGELRRELLPLRRAVTASSMAAQGDSSSPWYDEPYDLLSSGGRAYLDEQDVVSFLDPPKELIPFDPASYNPAAYLWKKIGDIPQQRRHRLLYLLKARLISRIWELAGTRYQDVKLAKKSASTLLSIGDNSITMEIWNCRTRKGPLPFGWLNHFKKAIFHGKDGGTYGRIIVGGFAPFGLATIYKPLYFKIRQVMEVMSTEQPCDLAYEFGDGLLDPDNIPESFPKPAKHPWPFNDHLVVYIRHAGPGVLVGQAWQEGKDLEQVPKKFCGEILMVKDCTAVASDCW